MSKFIELHVKGEPILVNTRWIEEIRPKEDGCEVYYAFNVPYACEQDYIVCDENYDKMRCIIWA